MKFKFKTINFELDWKVIVGLSGLVLLNKLSDKGQLKSLKLDFKNQNLALNS